MSAQNNPQCFDNRNDWARQVTRQFSQSRRAHHLLITDLDDTFLDANARWYDLYISLLNAKPQSGRQATVDEFKEAGPRVHLEHLVDDYPSLKERLINDATFNADLRLLSSAQDLQRASIPHGYISTRPTSLGETTRQNLLDLHLLDSPLLLRSKSIDYTNTIEYKLQALFTLRDLLDSAQFQDAVVYYVDDYKDLIERLNQNNTRIIGVQSDEHISWQSIFKSIGLC